MTLLRSMPLPIHSVTPTHSRERSVNDLSERAARHTLFFRVLSDFFVLRHKLSH